ncbi:hypothetical protein [Saccharopolyspora spinosa]|uniref:Uncharacterized protein n=1 Tax=Saccharopolyspora spinosa TaxID=60894 RepID=A0A2N3Y227_SACSN|nr:hypothetical protein [Saccharopolyspora spinosa]PKW16950.1 hypothetical protein A8926_4859 [Saccharopolyspora spinosa]
MRTAVRALAGLALALPLTLGAVDAGSAAASGTASLVAVRHSGDTGNHTSNSDGKASESSSSSSSRDKSTNNSADQTVSGNEVTATPGWPLAGYGW